MRVACHVIFGAVPFQCVAWVVVELRASLLFRLLCPVVYRRREARESCCRRGFELVLLYVTGTTSRVFNNCWLLSNTREIRCRYSVSMLRCVATTVCYVGYALVV